MAALPAEDRSALSSGGTVCGRRRGAQPTLALDACDAIEALTAERASRSYGPQWIMLDGIVSV
jgi:hypothetical protein